ncbi:MAG: hypothetical protein KDA90_21150 [Planctomycetaceae bacterium]|nr:hypothetical protein [Planctomycetaceae bacterium]
MGEVDSTVIAGVIIFVAGQIISKFAIEPLVEWQKLRGEIVHAIHYYANVYVAEDGHSREYGERAVGTYRDLAGRVWQQVYYVPLPVYLVARLFRSIPSKQALREVAASLTGLSNSVFRDDGLLRQQYRAEIYRALRIKQ